MKNDSAHADVTGIVLIGGRSRRFGSDKATFRLNGNSLASAALLSVKSVLPAVLVSGRADQKNWFPELDFLADDHPDAGPLSGIQTAFQRANTDWVFVLACDMPNVQPRAIDRLLSMRTGSTLAVVSRGHVGPAQPLFACYHRKTASICDEMVTEDDRSMQRFIRRISSNGLIVYPTFDAATLTNINRIEDLSGVPTTYQHTSVDST